MALWTCRECTTAFAVGLLACPHCQSTDYEEEGDMTPKITVHGGPSIAGATMPVGAWSDEAEPDTWPESKDSGAVLEVDDTPTEGDEGGAEPSPGNSSSASPERPPTSTEPSKPAPRKHARTTGNRSRKGRTGSSTASSTAGDRTEPTSASADGAAQ